MGLSPLAIAGPSLQINETLDSLEVGAPLNLGVYIISSTGPVSFQWYVSTTAVPTPTAIPGATSGAFTINAVTASAAGTYSVTVSDLTGPSTVTVAQVTIDPLTAPIFVSPPQPVTATDGQQAALTVTTTGSLPQTFQWYHGNLAISGSAGPTYTFSTVRKSDAGSYSVVASNAAGSTGSASAVLTVTSATPPSVSSQAPATNSIPFGNSFSLNPNIAGSYPIAFQWFKNGIAIPGATQGSYYVAYATGADSGTYAVKAVNAAGSVTTANSQVVVSAAVGITFNTQPAPLTTVQATSTNFSLVVWASGSSPMTYQWYKNNVPIPGATSNQLLIPVVQLSDAGTYIAVVSNPVGAVPSNPAVLVVTSPAPPTFSTASPYSQLIRQAVGSQLNLYSNNLVTPPIASFSQWYFNGQALAGQTSSYLTNYNFGYANVGEYVLKYSTAGGSITTPPIEVVATIPPNATNPSAWVDAQTLGSVVYFLYSSPMEILRYDMSTQEWLTTATFTSAPTAMRTSAEGVYVSFGQTGFLYSADLSTQLKALPNTAAPTSVIFLDQTHAYLYGINGSTFNGTFTALNRADQTFASTSSGPGSYEGNYARISVSAANEKAYAWGWGEEPSTLYAFNLASNGAVSGFTPVVTGGIANTSTRSYVSPDGSTLVAYDGSVYDAVTLAFKGNLAEGAFDDLCFLSTGKILAVRGNQFSLYDPSSLVLLARLDSTVGGLNVFEQGTTLFAFTPNGAGAVLVSTEDESDIAAAALAPAPALSTSAASLVTTAPDDSFIDKNWLLYLMDRIDRNILVWSPSLRTYLSSIPLEDYPDKFSYSATLHRIYVTYADGRITHIDLSSSLAEQPFTTVSSEIINFNAVDNQLYLHLQDPYDSGQYRALYSSSGSLALKTTWGYFEGQSYWDSATQDLYNYDTGLVGLPISTGAIGTQFAAAENVTAANPFRFSADGSLFVTGNGLVFNATSLANPGTLGGALTDAAWLGSSVYSIGPSASGSSLQIWSGSGYSLSGTFPLSGAPNRIWPIAGSKVVALTTALSGPIFTVLGSNGSVVSQDSNDGVPSLPPILTSLSLPAENQLTGSNVSFSATASGAGDTYQWEFNGTPLTGETSSTLTLDNVQTSANGDYQLVVTNAFGQTTTPYDFLEVSPSVVPFTVTTYPQSQVVLWGGTAVFSVAATGGTISYQWNREGEPIPGATGSTYVIPDVTPWAVGDYSVTITDVSGGQTQIFNPSVVSLSVVVNGGVAKQGDFTGNGNADILWQNTSNGDCGIYLMNGTAVTGWADLGTIAAPWRIGATGDFLGNGNTDIVWQNTSTGVCGIYMMNGTTVTGWVGLGTVPVAWKVVGTGDFLGDGNADIVWRNTSTGDCGIYTMNGTNVTGWVDLGTVPLQWEIVGVGAFNSTGQPDILWHNTSTGAYGFYMMNGTTVAGWTDLGVVPAPWRVGAVADYNEDGNTDILWQNTSTGDCGFYLMNGTTVTGWASLGTVPTQWRAAP